MSSPWALGSRIAAMRPLHRDALLAVVMTAALVVESGLQLGHSDRPVLCIVLVCVMGSTLIAIERAPAAAAAVTLIALGFYVRLAEVPDWTVPLLVVAFEFFAVGAAPYSMRQLVVRGAVLLAGSFVVLLLDRQDVTNGVLALLANTALFSFLPLAVGRVLHNRRLLAGELRARGAQLRRERDERARRAATEERTRIARELHDVIAHSVSVMVIQAQGAQRVAALDRSAACEALEAIERSGRNALHEMRTMIGVMRGADAAADRSVPGLAQLPALVERARAAGLDVEESISPDLPPLPLELDLIAFRVVQEALTNAMKHAGRAHAKVVISCEGGALMVEVTDDGAPGRAAPGQGVRGPAAPGQGARGPAATSQGAGGPAATDWSGGGHGLVGMRERLALYGGELTAGPRPGGGFRVTATVALDAAAGSGDPSPLPESTPRPSWRRRASRVLSDPRFELAFAVGVTVMAAADLLTSHHRRGGIVLNLVLAIALGACVALRRSHALLYATATIGLAVICTAATTDVRLFPLAFYLLLGPAYALAVYEDLPRGLVGLGVVLLGAGAVNLVAWRPAMFGDFLFPIAVLVCAFAVGRALWGGRALAAEIEGRNRRLAAEREHRERLAVAEERTRIARQLQVVVANEVSEMVVAAELARRRLDDDLAGAVRAMATIEETGRAALAEMRRILGVLRDSVELVLEPQPGLGAVHGLVERARNDGQRVELTVDGEPGPLPASIELAAYRVIEESLAQREPRAASREALEIQFSFREHELVLVLSQAALPTSPATIAIRERVAACHGELSEELSADGSRELRITLPTDSAAVFA